MVYPSVRAALRDGVRILFPISDSNGLLHGDLKLASGKVALVLIALRAQ